jgi:diguanylate cyclase (GGDEF)-like protein
LPQLQKPKFPQQSRLPATSLRIISMNLPGPESGHDRAFQTALEGYLHAISDIAETVSAIHPELGANCHEQLMRLHARLAFQADQKTLDETRNTLHETLAAFSARARRYSEVLTNELNRTLGMLAQSEGSRSVRYVAHLVDFVDQMEDAVRDQNLNRLAQQAQNLRSFAESIELDSRDDSVNVRERMDAFQGRLREAELLASLDPLTGLANRREFDRQLSSRIDAKREFCMLLFDLNQFKHVNDELGHLCGDELLRQVGVRLGGQVRPGDFVCRWGGDEFVVILDCALDPALARSRQLVQSLNGAYHATVEDREILVNCTVSAGVAQYRPGETPEQLFQRVDESMYKQKNPPERD